MRRVTTFALVLIIAAVAGCGGSSDSRQAAAAPGVKPTPGSYVEKGAFSPFYAEELHDGRIYLFGQQKTHEAFMKSKEPNPLKIKSFIKRGPNRETVIVETDKEAPTMGDRLWKQFQTRYGLSA